MISVVFKAHLLLFWKTTQKKIVSLHSQNPILHMGNKELHYKFSNAKKMSVFSLSY